MNNFALNNLSNSDKQRIFGLKSVSIDSSQVYVGKTLSATTCPSSSVGFTFSWYRGNCLGEYESTPISTSSTYVIQQQDMQKFIKAVAEDEFGTQIETFAFISDLPVVNIDTNGIGIVDKEKNIDAKIVVQGTQEVDCQYDEKATIHGRGSSSWMYYTTQQSYKIKLNTKTNLLGLGSSKHFILISNYVDNTFVRNRYAQELASQLGLKSIRMKPVVVVLNGVCKGVYMLSRHIRIESDCIDIYDWEDEAESRGVKDSTMAWVDEDSSIEVDGGFIYELESVDDSPSKFSTKDGLRLLVNRPDYAMSSDKMMTYSMALWNKYLNELKKDEVVADGNSLYDIANPDKMAAFLLINCIFNNYDANMRSRYCHQDVGGKIEFGPVWDFDRGLASVENEDDKLSPEGWNLFVDTVQCIYQSWLYRPVIFSKMFDMYNNVVKGWLQNLIENVLDNDKRELQSVGEMNDIARRSSQIIHPTIGTHTLRGYNGDWAYMRQWLSSRKTWLDAVFGDIRSFENSFSGIISLTRQQNNLDIVDNDLYDFTSLATQSRYSKYNNIRSVNLINASAIENDAFTNKGIQTITADVCTSIGESAFAYCSSLTTASFPNATSIGTYAFFYCTSLATASFPNATSIGTSAFRNCYSLTTASFPNATSISTWAFAYCSSLSIASFPNATSIGSSAFHNCTRLSYLYVDNDILHSIDNGYGSVHQLVVSNDETKLVIAAPAITKAYNDTATSIGTSAFFYCSSLTTASFPNATSIGTSAFYNCTSLATISFPNATSIGTSAFCYCSRLTTASFPNATSIEEYTFYNCSRLTTASFPSATSIGSFAFAQCSSLSIASFPNATSIGINAFAYCYNITTASFPNATSIGTYAFRNCYNITTASFPNATSIEEYTFYNCSRLTTASFPNATSIGTSAFYNCTSLATISFPNATSIDTNAFFYCTRLSTISFPNATSISTQAFAQCSSLSIASFPNATSIGTYAFIYCSRLTSIYFTGSSIPKLANSNAFLGVATNYSIYVAESLYNSYLTANQWSMVSSHITFEHTGPDLSIPLCFEAVDAGATIALSKNGTNLASATFQTSTDGTNWSDYTYGTYITLANVGDKVYFRAKDDNTSIARNNSNYLQFETNDSSKLVNVSGNIMSLLAPEFSEMREVSSFCFQCLFEGCQNIYDCNKLNLPATTLSEGCYSKMFFYCTSLTEAPDLPAETLAEFCYSKMFFYCTSLTEAPELPATTLASNCYSSMFQECTSLTQAPDLPATTLADNCYSYMFFYCTSLTEAPELPATTLASNCYDYMFYDCSEFTECHMKASMEGVYDPDDHGYIIKEVIYDLPG